MDTKKKLSHPDSILLSAYDPSNLCHSDISPLASQVVLTENRKANSSNIFRKGIPTLIFLIFHFFSSEEGVATK